MSHTAEAPLPILNQEAVSELTTRAVDSIYPSADALSDELLSGRRLRAYMGIDPTGDAMHVGHMSQLHKLRRLQDLGHDVILLIGDFTAMIGDPTDRSAARVKLSREEVLENAQGYKEQASKILDFEGPNPVRLKYNSHWLGKMSFADVLELYGNFTVQQMLERRSFRERVDSGRPVNMTEFLYPGMQGWDSVQMGVDIEGGGSDQIFNMLAGSDLVKRHLGKQKYVIAGNLLVDPTGRKIGKTEGNMVTMVDPPADMYQKVMRWGDAIAPHALELCTTMPMADVGELANRMEAGEVSGLAAKMLLAETLVTELHGAPQADEAAATYQRLTAKGREVIEVAEIPTAAVAPGENIVDILVRTGLASSRNVARTLLTQNGVRVNGETVTVEWQATPGENTEAALMLQVGKKRLQNFRKLTFASEATEA